MHALYEVVWVLVANVPSTLTSSVTTRPRRLLRRNVVGGLAVDAVSDNDEQGQQYWNVDIKLASSARSTDITVCPDKLDWGLSYDDGPSPYTPLLLDYRESHAQLDTVKEPRLTALFIPMQSTPTT